MGLTLLRALSTTGDDKGHNDARETVVVSGAIQVIVVALQMHPDRSDVQEEGLAVLSLLAEHSKDAQSICRDAGAVSITLNAMQTHPETLSVYLYGYAVLAATLAEVHGRHPPQLPAGLALPPWQKLSLYMRDSMCSDCEL